MSVLRVAAAVITDPAGRFLLVRKRGTSVFMQAGGKIEPGEEALAALVRELREELGVAVPDEALTPRGTWRADAANEPGVTVEAALFDLDLTAAGVDAADLHPAAEIEELRWVAPQELLTFEPLAPLAAKALLADEGGRFHAMATSFGTEAAAYERGRPEYPDPAVAWLLGDAQDVVDVGAGTGKLTRAVAGLGRRVLAVDPDPSMLARLVSTRPGTATAHGTGERIPVDDAGADAVTFGQAWHWVDPVAACLEAGRVLRPGGFLGLIWNVRDESVPWVSRLSGVMHHSAAERLITSGGPAVATPFGALEHETWRWERTLTVDDLVDLAASRSYVITAAPADRARILDGVRAIGEQVAVDGVLVLPYVTHAYRARRP